MQLPSDRWTPKTPAASHLADDDIVTHLRSVAATLYVARDLTNPARCLPRLLARTRPWVHDAGGLPQEAGGGEEHAMPKVPANR